MADTKGHSPIGASGMHRWAQCPGSVKLSVGMPNYESPEAAEGTLAHHLGEHALRTGLASVLGIKEFEGKKLPDDMPAAVQVYIETVRAKVQAGCELVVECSFDLSRIHPGLYGTADAVVFDPRLKRLYVFDYKHGQGKVVEVIGNPQLRYYALGALLTTGFQATQIEITIVQPRANHPDGPVRSETMDVVDLLDFRADLKDYAVATEQPDAPLKSGDWCRWCRAKPTCPLLQKQAREIAVAEFKPVSPPADWRPDPVQLGDWLKQCEAAEIRISAIRELAYQEAMRGRPPAGFKMVAKRATRKWRNNNEAAQVLNVIVGMKDEDIFEEPSIRSPAQIEDKLGKKVFAAEVAVYVTKESSGFTLVAESDKRPAVKLDAASEFAPVSGVPPVPALPAPAQS